MDALTLEGFTAQSADYDAEVARTRDIDQFCSASDWIVPAHHAFGPEREPFIFRSERGWLALMRAHLPDGRRVLQPLEAAWGFASPLIAADVTGFADDVVELLEAQSREWDLLVATGVVEGSAAFNELGRRLARRHRLYRGEVTRRFRASLAGGVEGFLARRSANTRRGLRRAARDVRAAGIVIGPEAGPPEALYARVLAIEARSWKGLEHSGLSEQPMRGFYAQMVPRLAARGALRLSFARLDGEDVGYILSGVFERTYRGLQFSFDARFETLGLGNAMQLAQITQLAEEGMTSYDLGSDVPYKARWGEETFETVMLIAVR